ncbi:transposase [Moorena sp. SIOASIH]|uniref:transposase n=1 Tax=Moorena sp. SIOASIH TaxID=2607817 RepID=UPI00344DA7FF
MTKKKGQSAAHDGGKKVKGRKRHIVFDYLRLLIGVLVRSANGSAKALSSSRLV